MSREVDVLPEGVLKRHTNVVILTNRRAHTFIYISPEYLSRLPEETKRQRHSSIYSVFDSVSNRNARRHVVVLVCTNNKRNQAQDLSTGHPKRYRENVFLTFGRRGSSRANVQEREVAE